MDLVVHHVLEALVVRGPDEDLGGQLAAGEAVVQNLHTERRRALGDHARQPADRWEGLRGTTPHLNQSKVCSAR